MFFIINQNQQTPDIKPAVKRKLEGFVKPVLALRKMANEVRLKSLE